MSKSEIAVLRPLAGTPEPTIAMTALDVGNLPQPNFRKPVVDTLMVRLSTQRWARFSQR